jgi:predicted permease
MTGLLFSTCIPLAALVLLGFIIGKLQNIDLKSVATLAIYAITPLVAFGSAAQLNFTPALILLPVCTFIIAAVIGLASYAVGVKFVGRSEAGLLPVACGSGNTGYFGLPIALALFGPEAAGTYFLANLGVVVFETSVGFYFVARGQLSSRDAFKRVAGLPVLYALIIGLIFAALHIGLPAPAIKLWDLCKGAYVVVGMMIAGIALAQARGFAVNPRLSAIAFTGKFLLWPLAALAFAVLDPGLFGADVHKLILVLSMDPVAANLPAYAAANNAPIRDAAMLVLVSTIVAIAAIPLVLPRLL